MRSSHVPCGVCRRLLVPVGGVIPAHRVPASKIYGRAAVPLTGADSDWCRGGTWVTR